MLLLMLTSFSFSFVACKEQPQKDLGVFHTTSSSGLDLDVIQQNGELIAVAMYGQDTYFEHQGEGFGAQYMIAREFARSIGCTIRLDVMPDSASMIHRLDDGRSAARYVVDLWCDEVGRPCVGQESGQGIW